MAKLWAKVNGTWVSLGAQSKDDVGLGNVENFTHTNSATDGSSSKYATGAAVKEAYDRATQALENSGGLSVGPVQLAPYALFSTSSRFVGEPGPTYNNRNDNGEGQLMQGLHALGSYMLVGRDRSDTILTGCQRDNKSGYIQLRAYYRRIL